MNSRLITIVLAVAIIIAIIVSTQLLPQLPQVSTATVISDQASHQFNEQLTNAANASPDYSRDVQPILEQRCVVCYACYDAPCQLKLGSIEGLSRGANKAPVYDGERLLEANLTRLFEDAHTTEQWRKKNFFPVVSDTIETPQENLQNSLLAQMLLLKNSNPLPKNTSLPDELTVALNQNYQCPTIAQFDSYKANTPLSGMPYGLPAIEESEQQLLLDWIAQGSAKSSKSPISKALQARINRWEVFLNSDDKKSQLMTRYLFEHLFLAHLHFDDGLGENIDEHFNEQRSKQYFKLVRSATPPGQPVEGIFTRRPFDDPKVKRVYYRFQAVLTTIVHKSHMPIKLDKARMARWSTWFLDPIYQVNSLPSYKPEEASNPFITFAQIPVKSRYRYMLDEAQNTIMQFIKGPVCRGQMALNVINDHFWVMFASPDLAFAENNNKLMQQARQKIALPAEEESNALPTSWLTYAAMEKEYLKAKSRFIKKEIKNKVPVTLNILWDGDGVNDNATLTIFRHNDAASVVKGLVGDTPQTAWVLTYPLFERIHYLLVAGYDVYGNLGHQLNSRLYMDFLRMEGEFNFLNLIPIASREQVRNKWYRGSVSNVEKYIYEANQVSVESDINYQTNDPLPELYQKLQDHFSHVSSKKHQLTANTNEHDKVMPNSLESALQKINNIVGTNASLIPDSSIVRITDVKTQKTMFYTLLRNNAYSNISHLFAEADRRLPKEDTITIAPGLMTSHPNAFFTLTTLELNDFANTLSNINSKQDYKALRDKYGVYRSSENFWSYADAMHNYFKQHSPIEFGLLDFNRLENR